MAIHRAIVCSSSSPLQILPPPSHICNFSLNLHEFLQLVEIEYANGDMYKLPAEFLRIYSPAADSKILSFSGEKVIFGRRCVGIMSGEPVGNYRVRLLFDDLHKTGIYTWDYLHDLGQNKFALMRKYIKTLKKHELSRDPSKR